MAADTLDEKKDGSQDSSGTVKEPTKEQVKGMTSGFVIKETAEAYTKGVLIGGVVSCAFALITKRRRILLWTLGGGILGGFVTHQFKSKTKPEAPTTKFKNHDI